MRIGFFRSLCLMAALGFFTEASSQTLVQPLPRRFTESLAQTSSSSSVLDLSETNTFKKNKSPYSLEAFLQGINYFSSSSSDSTFQQQAEISGLFSANFNQVNFAGEALLGTLSGSSSHYQAVPELYVSYGDLKSNFVFIGRKKIQFSALDENEHLGLYQSFFSNDFINFKSQGLIGLGGQLSNGYVGLIGGAFSQYIPNQAPQVSVENGKIQSGNRWARRPPPEFSFMDKNRRIDYAIRDYSIWEIMNSPGYAASIFLNPKQMIQLERPLIKASYAHLPINDIPLARETYGNIQLVGQVLLSPTVTYHEVQSIDLNLDANELFQTTWSYLQDQPDNQVAREGETLQYLEPLQIVGVQIKSDLSKVLNRRLMASVQYSEIRGGEIKDLQSNGQLGSFNFSSRRARFQKPLTFAASSEFTLARKDIISELKWTYDTAERGSLVSGIVQLKAWQDLAVHLGFDVLGVEDENSTEQSFLQLNQANDRIYGGLNYVF